MNEQERKIALVRAVRALEAMQRPSGEFPTFTSRRADMADARPYQTSIYTTSFVLYALRSLAEFPSVAQMRERAAAFLRSQRNPDASWSYEGLATTRVPPDLDDTTCAAAALHSCGEAPDLGLFSLLWANESAPGGPYYTWVGVNQGEHLLARQVDALVQANILLLSGLTGVPLLRTAAYLCDVAQQRRWADASDYCFTPHLLLFCAARAYAAGAAGLAALAETFPTAMETFPTDDPNPFQHACLAATLVLADHHTQAAPYLDRLLAAQLPDGSWPIAASYSGYPPHFDGSPALTTAIALEALQNTKCE